MKALKNVLFLVLLSALFLLFVLATSALAQGDPAAMPEKLLKTNWRDWQLDGVTLIFGLGVLGRAIAALKAGGGIVGMAKGILFGTNAPLPPKA